ncbi:MAG: hypothetical protein JWL90_2404, partial [Chthoniobacteraceae bacterium]|nr:hypothetical protein [Chthoniobacteraceae bacterium]
MMHTHRTRLKSIGEILLLGTLYYLLARLGLWFSVADSNASPVWPAGGIAWAAVLIFGPRVAPGIWLGSFAINLQFLLPLKAWSMASVATASTIALGSALQALVAFFLIRRAIGSVPRSPREIFLFLAIAAASCVMTPSLGVAGMCFNGIIQSQNYWDLWRPWWFGDFSGVAIVTPLLWTLGSAPKRGLLAGALFPLTCLGVGVSLLAFFGIRRIGDNTIAETFARNGADIANTIRRSVDARMSDLGLIGAFHSASNAVERSEFRDFVEPLLTPDKSITTFAWVPRVPESEREAFIAEARRDGFADFEFKHFAAGKERAPDSDRSDCFPIYFIEPAKGSEPEIGLDLASDPERRRVIEKMRDLGKAVAAPAMREGVEKTGAKGIAFYWPVYQRGVPGNSPARQREELKGFYMVSFRIGDLMEDALNYLSPMGIDVYLLDESAGPEGELLYSHPSRPDRSLRVQEAASLRIGPQYMQTLKVGTRTWSVLCKPGPDYFPNRRSSLPWVVLIFGLGSTGLLGVFINSQQRAEAALRRLNKDLDTLVQQRTAELAVVETANYAIVSADSKGRIIGWNKGASAIFGMEEEAMRGKELTVLIPERHRAAHTRGMERFIATGGASMIGKTVELDGLRKDGAEFPVEMSLSTWKLAGETYFSAIMRDV